MTQSRPTSNLSIQIDPELKRWLRLRAGNRGISLRELVEAILAGHRAQWETGEQQTDEG